MCKITRKTKVLSGSKSLIKKGMKAIDKDNKFIKKVVRS